MDAKYKKHPYLRVANDYFKSVTTNDFRGIPRTELIQVNKSILIDDFGVKGTNKLIRKMRKYNKFSCVPNYKDHSYELPDLYYNLFQPLAWKPRPGAWKVTEMFLKHIFKEQYLLGLQYMQALYLHPKQPLPILCLVSTEQGTGKTTYIKWLSTMFSGNTVITNPSEMMSHNSGVYADKNIIAIEEVGQANQFFYRKLKFLATADQIIWNHKYIREASVPFYGKLILTSNDVSDFLKAEQNETRLWIRELGTVENEQANLLDRLIEEMPHFLNYLDSMKPLDLTKARLMFKPEQLQNSSLAVLKEESHTNIYREIVNYAETYFDTNPSRDELPFTIKDIQLELFPHNNQVTYSDIRKCIRDEMDIPMQPRSRWTDTFGAPKNSTHYIIYR